MTFSHFFRARTNLWYFWRAGVSHFGFESGSLPRIALSPRCGGFLRFFRACSFDTIFANFKRISSNSPLLLCFTLFCVFFLGLGSTQPCTCVLRQLAQNPFFIYYKNIIFPLKRVMFVHFSVSPFLLGFIDFSFSLSLSFYISLVSCYFSILVVFFLFYRVVFFPYFSCLVSLLLFHEKNNINILHVKSFSS